MASKGHTLPLPKTPPLLLLPADPYQYLQCAILLCPFCSDCRQCPLLLIQYDLGFRPVSDREVGEDKIAASHWVLFFPHPRPEVLLLRTYTSNHKLTSFSPGRLCSLSTWLCSTHCKHGHILYITLGMLFTWLIGRF